MNMQHTKSRLGELTHFETVTFCSIFQHIFKNLGIIGYLLFIEYILNLKYCTTLCACIGEKNAWYW